MFPNIHFPGAVSSESAKYRQMALEGDGWRSPIFDIGSAKPTENIPQPKKITQKSPHRQNRAGSTPSNQVGNERQGAGSG